MRPTPNRPQCRAGFTLVELLVVITIIAILVSLTSAAVVRAIAKGDELRVRNDISQLGVGVESFKTDFAVSYLPSRLILPPAFDSTGESSQYISSLWPRIDPTAFQTTPAAFAFWGVPSQNSQGLLLSGDQCLVFFLGGYRDANNNTFGWSTNPKFPQSPPSASNETRKGPYFAFPPSRLQGVSHNINNSSPTPSEAAFPSFIDIYGAMPYLYFSTRKTANDYPSVPANGGPAVVSITVNSAAAGAYTVYPYQVSGAPPDAGSSVIRVWANKSSFQIISAGKDTQFGAGGVNWPGYVSGGTPGSTTLPGLDDLSNFHPTLLGVPAQ